MSSNKGTGNDGSNAHDLTMSPVGQLGLQISTQEVDDALNFDLDFDAMADMGDALPNINLDEMGSLGTRSPSPTSGSASVMSKSSKRSRADFDSESECDSQREKASRRMVFQSGPFDSGMNKDEQQHGGESSPTKVIRQDREREGRCPDCGLDTHRIVMNENGFELQPLTIEGEVLNGRCLLCNPMEQVQSMDKSASAKATPKKGGKKSNGESSAPKKKGGRHSDADNETALNSSIHDGSGVKSYMSPPPHQQQRKMMHNMKSPPGSGNLPFPPPGRGDTSRRSSGKFLTPTPNQYHSKMALMKQAQLPRKHTAMQHATMAFGSTNNRGDGGNKNRKTSGARRFSSGSGAGGGGIKPPGPPTSQDRGSGGSGMWAQQPDRPHHSSNGSLSSVSCSEVESAHHVPSSSNARDPHDGDDNYSKASQFSQNSVGGGGLGKAMAMGMGMHCAETASAAGPQTPAHSGRPTLMRSGSSAQTPQSVPVNMSNTMSARMAQQTPQSMPPNMNNIMSSRVGSSGSGHATAVQSSQSISGVSNMNDKPNLTGNVPQAVRLAHSKLQSSIYHHHIFPISDETERAHVEKTLVYLESGSGDICDIIVAMRRFPFSLPIQRVSCEKLYAHCFDQEHAHAIGLVGGIRTIIDAMEHHPEDVILQRGCAGVIKHLAGASTYNLEMLDRMGALAIIVSTMERHPKNASLLESCCWAMEAMTRSNSSEIKMRVAKGGGIHAAMKAVEMFPNNETLLRAAFHCLRQLGYNPSSYSSGQGPGNALQAHLQQQQQQQQRQPQNQQNQQQQQQQGQGPFRGNMGSMGGGGGGGGGGGNMRGGMMNQMMMGNNSMMMGNNSMMGTGSNNNANNRRM